MTSQPVSMAEFQDYVDRFGEDIDGWPSHLQPSAAALLRDSAEARDIVAQARRLRQLVRGPAPKAPPGLKERIVAAALGDKAGPGQKRPK